MKFLPRKSMGLHVFFLLIGRQLLSNTLVRFKIPYSTLKPYILLYFNNCDACYMEKSCELVPEDYRELHTERALAGSLLLRKY